MPGPVEVFVFFANQTKHVVVLGIANLSALPFIEKSWRHVCLVFSVGSKYNYVMSWPCICFGTPIPTPEDNSSVQKFKCYVLALEQRHGTKNTALLYCRPHPHALTPKAERSVVAKSSLSVKSSFMVPFLDSGIWVSWIAKCTLKLSSFGYHLPAISGARRETCRYQM